MEFTIQYTGIECSNGHNNYYTREKCDVCGEKLTEKETEIDPLVVDRREFFKEYIEQIYACKTSWEQYRKEVEQGIQTKIALEEPFDNIANLLSKATEMTNENSFDGMEVSEESIDDSEFKANIEAIVMKIEDFYGITSELVKLDCNFTTSNLRNRLVDTILHYIEYYRSCFDAFVALDLDECELVQEKISDELAASEREINMFSRIMDNMNLFGNVDIFERGAINHSAIFAMIFGTEDVTPMENIRLTAELAYDYFEDLLDGDYHSFDVEELLNLSSYVYLGTSVFSEVSFNKKIQVVLEVLDKASEAEPNDFGGFIEKYLETYIDLSKQLDEFSKFFIFILGTATDEEIMMKSALTMYKDMAEGTFRDISKILFYSKKVIEGKEVLHDDILSWSKFGEIYSEFLSDRKLGLECLTDGVNTLIRNAEAHVSYFIDEKNRKVKLISSDSRKKKIREQEYTYEDFFNVLNTLSETVFSIFAGITIFFLNRKSDFESVYSVISKCKEESVGDVQIDMVMAMNGFVITDRSVFVDEGISTQKLCAIDVRDEREKDLDTLLFTLVASVAKDNVDVDYYCINIVDEKAKVLGTALVPTKDLKDRYDNEDMRGLTAMALARLCSEFTGNVKADLTDSETMLIKVIFNLLNIIRNKALECVKNEETYSEEAYSQCIEVLCNEIDEIQLLIAERYMYTGIPYEVIHVNGMIKLFRQVVGRLITTKRFSTSRTKVYEDFDSFSALSSCFKEYYEGSIDFQGYVGCYTNDVFSRFEKLEVNKPCPCGSGKKYKKCCRV